MHHGNQRDGSFRQNFGWKRCVKHKWVKQVPRTLDTEWRASAGRAQKGINGSRRPYIKPQGAASKSSVDHENQTIKISQDIKANSQSSKLQGSHNNASCRMQLRGKPTRSKILRIETQVAEVREASHG